MKKIALLLMTTVMTCGFMSCEDDKESCPPVYGGFTVEPAQPHPGDSITLTAKIVRKGVLLYGTTYNWTLRVNVLDATGENVTDSTLYMKQTITSDGSQYEEPTCKFKLPKNIYIPQRGTTTAYVSFSANFKNAADGPEKASYPSSTSEGCFGTISSYAYTLYSTANGSGQFSIYAK